MVIFIGIIPAASFLQRAKELVHDSLKNRLPEQNCGLNKFPHSVKPCSLGGKGKKEFWPLTNLTDTKHVKMARFLFSFGANCAGNLAAALGGRLPTKEEVKEIVKTDQDPDKAKDLAGRIKKFAELNPAPWLKTKMFIPYKTSEKDFAEFSFVNWYQAMGAGEAHTTNPYPCWSKEGCFECKSGVSGDACEPGNRGRKRNSLS